MSCSISIKKKLEGLQLQKDSAMKSVEKMKELVKDATTVFIANSEEMENLKKRLNYLEMVWASAEDTITKVTAKLEEKKKLLVDTRKEQAKLEVILLERKMKKLRKISAMKLSQVTSTDFNLPSDDQNIVNHSAQVVPRQCNGAEVEGTSVGTCSKKGRNKKKKNVDRNKNTTFDPSPSNGKPNKVDGECEDPHCQDAEQKTEEDEECERRIMEMENKLKNIGNTLQSLRKRMLKQQLRLKLPSRMQKRQNKLMR